MSPLISFLVRFEEKKSIVENQEYLQCSVVPSFFLPDKETLTCINQ